MKYINLCPHPINVVDDDGKSVLNLPRSETPLRLPENVTEYKSFGGINFSEVELSLCELPTPMIDTIYIVSMPTCIAVAEIGRVDIVYPYGQVCDESGAIVGCRGFARVV